MTEEARVSRGVVLAVLSMLIVIVVANNSAGSLAQPAIGQEFAAGPADVGWVVFGFASTFAVGTALWGGIARRVGLGPSLAIGATLVALGSAVAAFAPSLDVLIGARLVQGAGAGAIPTLGTALVAGRFDGPERARAMGAVVASVGTGLAVGPLVGGLALELAGWRANVGIGLLAAPAIPLLYATDRIRQPGARIDARGAVLVAVVVLTATFLLNRLPVLGASPISLAAAAMLLVGGALLVRHSIRRPDAFLPKHVLGAPAFQRSVFLGAIGMSAFLGSLVLVPPGIARAHGVSGLALAMVLLPMAVAAALTSYQIARIEQHLGRRATASWGMIALGAGALALASIGAAGPLPLVAAAMGPIGAGFGLIGTPILNELTLAFEGPDRPVAVGAYNLGFFLGGAAGAAIGTAFVQIGLELPLFAGRAVPGFSSAELLLAIGPLMAAAFLVARRPLEAPASQ
jgi:MFS family permease